MANDPEETGRNRHSLPPQDFHLPLWSNEEKTAVVWSIAGFDPSSGAGVTADLMTFAAHGLFGCSAITALTMQSTLGVSGWEAVSPDLLRQTLQCLQEDVPAAGIKLGMLGTPGVSAVVAEFLREVRKNRRPVAVWDPVLRSSSGRDLYPAEHLDALRTQMLPVVDWITPNWAELALLAEAEVRDIEEAARAARRLCAGYPGLSVVATGGDQSRPVDLLVQQGRDPVSFEGTRVETTSTHGTGCAFSSALLAQLVRGTPASDAVAGAKTFVEGALRQAPGVGHGRGPMGLLWPLRQARE